MAEQEEDFSSLPFPDRFAHKNWKVRKQGYEDAAKAFESTPDESDPVFRPFLLDSGLWKGAVADSNVAAQQEGINALCSFLKYGGRQAASRSRNASASSLAEKGLASTRPAAKQSALEALLLYIELDKSDPIIEDLLPFLSHKTPKLIAATLAAFTAIYHAYGVKIVDPKPVLKSLPKVFGHADKNVRAESSNLAVELYRWLRDAMKTLFWNELKPVQQQDLEKLFEGIKHEPPPKQERLLRSQQAAAAAAPAEDEPIEGDEDGGVEPAEVEAFDLAEPVDVISKVPKDFNEKMASAKWKDRKEALDALFEVANTERIQEGHFDDIIQALAKSMKDANIAVVTVAANCVDVLAKGLRRPFARYRGRIMSPMMERLKEKKQSVADALGSALDSVFATTGLSDCLEDILEFLKHKNPQVKGETLKFLIRCLKTTREAPSKPETKAIADAATKLLTESTEATRSGGAEVLGTLMKIMGERAMGPYMEGLDDIRKTKIKEYFDAAEVKAKDKPKPVAPPPKAAPPAQKRAVTKKSAPGLKKPTPRASTPPEEPPPPPQPKPPGGRSVPSKLSGLSKPGVAAPSSGLKGPSKLGSLKPPSNLQSPRRNITPPTNPDEESAPAPKPPRSLSTRPLGRPTPLSTSSAPPEPAPNPALSAAERTELEALRVEKDSAQRTIDDLLSSKSKLQSEIHELQNQNAQLIEDHTRDVLSIKAKETQLVRARSDAESAEATVSKQNRELDRLRKELNRLARAASPANDGAASGAAAAATTDSIYRDPDNNNNNSRPNGLLSRQVSAFSTASNNASRPESRTRTLAMSPSEEKENGLIQHDLELGKQKDPDHRERSVSPARPPSEAETVERDEPQLKPAPQPLKSRAAYLTSELRAKIETIRARQGISTTATTTTTTRQR